MKEIKIKEEKEERVREWIEVKRNLVEWNKRYGGR